MNLRDLLYIARAAGWTHLIYSGSFGREHIWRRGDTQVAWEQDMRRLTISHRNRALVAAERGYRQQLSAHVDNVGQVVKMLAAYDITPCDCHARLMRILADLDAIRQAGADAFANSHRRLLALHANNGTPVGGA